MEANTTAPKTRGTEFFVNNFIGKRPLGIQAASEQAEFSSKTLVDITQRAGSLSFQHTLTFDQCHIMAEALVKAAAEAHAMFKAAKTSEGATQ